jgi:1-phosphatidylinositol phosphodiesterase
MEDPKIKWDGLVQDLHVMGEDGKPGLIKTPLSPVLLGGVDRLFLIWCSTTDRQMADGKVFYEMFYSIFQPSIQVGGKPDTSVFDQGAWTKPLRVTKELTTSIPTVANLEGAVHLVFTNNQEEQIHLQYDDVLGIWGSRAGVGIRSAGNVCLGASKGVLWCVVQQESEQYSACRWDRAKGWSASVRLKGLPRSIDRFSLFEWNGTLHFICNMSNATPEDSPLNVAIFKPANYTHKGWEPLEEGALDLKNAKSQFGATGTRFRDAILVAYGTPEDCIVKRSVGGLFVEEDEHHTGTSCRATPAVAVVNQEPICIWPDRDLTLQVITGKLFPDAPGWSRWPVGLKDDLLISELTIPGTHDAMSRSRTPWIGTQTLSIPEQLNSGIRYFDLRAGFSRQLDIGSKGKDGVVGNTLYAFHGQYPLQDGGKWIELKDILQNFYTFLAQNPNDMVIIQLKQDPGMRFFLTPEIDAVFAEAVDLLITPDEGWWRLNRNVPKVSELRGKIQLVRRFPLPMRRHDMGIDLSAGWPNNTSDRVSVQRGPTAQIQDKFFFKDTPRESIAKEKFDKVRHYLVKARTTKTPEMLFINYASANNLESLFSLKYPDSLTPWHIAFGYNDQVLYDEDSNWIRGVNDQIDEFLKLEFQKDGSGRYGIVVLDYPEAPESLLGTLITMNQQHMRNQD